MTKAIKSKLDKQINLEEFKNRSVRNTVKRVDELCDAVMDHVLAQAEKARGHREWSLAQVEAINDWLDTKAQSVGQLLKRSPEETASISDNYLQRKSTERGGPR